MTNAQKAFIEKIHTITFTGKGKNGSQLFGVGTIKIPPGQTVDQTLEQVLPQIIKAATGHDTTIQRVADPSLN